MKRLFIAIKIKEVPSLILHINKLKEKLNDVPIKWVESNNLHITLNFIGEISETKIDQIQKIIDSIIKYFNPFIFNLEGVDFFEKNKSPRVLFINIKKTKEIESLSNLFNNAFIELGIQKKMKHKVPHLTLGRIKYFKNKNLFNDIISDYENKFLQEIQVNEIILYESILYPRGPEYMPLKVFKL